MPSKLDNDQDAELLRWLQLTAQRADQLAAALRGQLDDLAIWLRAEEDVLGWSALSPTRLA